MIGFIIGLGIGALFGMCIFAILGANGRDDK